MVTKNTQRADRPEAVAGKLRSGLLRLVRRWAIRPKPSLGVLGERHAAKYLRKRGYRIVARNRRHRKGEIDLIVMDREFLVFVEVRTRASEDFITPEMSIRHDKQQTVRKTVRRLVRRHKTAGLRARIDVIAIIWPDGEKAPSIVRHHKGVIPIASW